MHFLYFCAEEIPPRFCFFSSHRFIIFHPRIQTRARFAHAHAHESRTKESTARKSKTAVSHTVTVATVAGSARSTVCHIWVSVHPPPLFLHHIWILTTSSFFCMQMFHFLTTMIL